MKARESLPCVATHGNGAQRRKSAAPQHVILAMQQQFGNHAVQLFVGKEHKALGDSTGRSVDLGDGVVLSWGDVIALAGDEYPDFDMLEKDSRSAEGKQRLRAAIQHDGIASAATGGLAAPTPEQVSARTTTFVGLAADNASHFNGDGSALANWAAQHGSALTAALEAGLSGDPAAEMLAQGREAFSEHFLTDAFSGGHIRTPRADIIGWYRANFAPRVVDFFVTTMKARLVDALVEQISPQTNWPDFVVRRKVTGVVDEKLVTGLATIGGHVGLVEYFALAVAGAVSGAMHDLEGERGVMVTSEAHPEPWRAFGDDQLGDSPVSRAQAEAAVEASTAEVDRAQAIGAALRHDGDPTSRPAASYFAFDNATLVGQGLAQAKAAGAYLKLHPDQMVTLTGNADPTGTEPYNDDLGLKRAQAVADVVSGEGVDSDRISIVSAGESKPVSTTAATYRLDRRVDYVFTQLPICPPDATRDAALAALANELPAPYPAVTRFVPHPVGVQSATSQVPASSVSTQVELEDWKWGSVPPRLRGQVDAWIRGKADMVAPLLASPALAAQQVEGHNINPRLVVETFLAALTASPTGYLETAFGETMSP